MRALRGLLLLPLVFNALTGAGQQPPELERGFKPELAYQFNGLDSVNLFNGNLNLNIPLGTYTVASDVSYSFTLRYAGNIWSYYWDCPPPGHQNPPPCEVAYYPLIENAGLGWQLSFGRLEFTGSLYGDQLPTGGTVKYVSPDGSEHNFYETLHEPKCTTGSSNCDTVEAGVFYTRDGSYLRLKVDGSARVVEFPDGKRHRYEHTGGVTLRLKYIYSASSVLDSSGTPLTKWVAVEYIPQDPNTPWLADWKITDSQGRAHWVILGAADPYRGQIDRIRLAAARRLEDPPTLDQYAEYKLTYGNYTIVGGQPVNGGLVGIPRPCWVIPPSNVPVQLLRRIDLPGSEVWELEYDTTDCELSGTLTRATLPTGGSVNWSYQQYAFGGPALGPAIGIKERCLRRDANPCSLTGSPSMQDEYTKYSSTTTGVATVDTYARNSTGTWARDTKVMNYFNVLYDALMGLPFTSAVTDGTSMARNLSSEIFDCHPETNICETSPERKQYVKYEMDATTGCDPIYPCGRERNRRVVSDRTLYVADGGRYANTDRSNFDGLGNYRTSISLGFSATEPARETMTMFNPSVGTYAVSAAGARIPGYTMLGSGAPWIIGTYTSSYVLESGSASHVEACFDSGTGFLKRMRLKASGFGARGSTDLLRQYTRDPQTGYASREEYFGGDLQPIDAPTPLCTMPTPPHSQYSFQIDHTYEFGTLKTSRFAGVPWYSVENSVIDRNTGLVLQSKDSAGLATKYEYDGQRRLKEVSPPGLTPTTFTYVPRSGALPARVEARTGTGLARTEERWEFDPFGRIELEKRLMPSQLWSARKRIYDSRGRQASVSEWENESSATFTNATKYGAYDLFGRVGTITAPDLKTTTFVYAGDRLTTRSYVVAKAGGDATVSIEEHRDRSGRLIKVVEDSTGIDATTDYTYDQANRLTTAKIWSGATSQLRTFIHDRRGLLVSETHPESGTTSYQYDARGNVITRSTPAATLTNCYDAAGRIKSVLVGDAPSCVGGEPLKEFTYETSTGRLGTTKRHNRTPELGNITVTEAYQYNGIGGRLSRKDTFVQRPSGETQQFYDQYAYNTLGNIASITYPLCASGSCTSVLLPSRVISPAYRHGLVTDVGPYTQGFQNPTGITYHPSGMLASVEHRNVSGTAGPRLVQTTAADGMPRPQSITVTNFCVGLSVSTPAPQPRSVPYNGAAGLSVTTVGGTTYQWYRVIGASITAVSGQTAATLTVPVTETSTYFVRVGNGVCTVDSERAIVTVQSCTAPDATITAPSSMVASQQATASVVSTSGATYQWSIPSGGTIVSGQGTNAITFGANCSGTVSLAVTVTKDGCSSNDTHSVSVSPATVTMSAIGATTILQGGSAQIRLTFIGSGPWTVTWSDLPSQPQTIQPQNNPYTRTMSPSVTTSYSVTAVDQYACAMIVSGAPITITVKPPAPWGVQATAGSTTQVTVTWGFSGSADQFDIYRSGTVSPIGSVSPSAFTFTDNGAAASASYVYTVRAVKSGTESDASAGDLATTVIFTDHPLLPGTPVRAQHITQLRIAVNAVRAAAGMAAQSFPTITPGVTVVSASHVEALRTALAPARSALGLPGAVYTRAPLVPGMFILATDLSDTRGGVR